MSLLDSIDKLLEPITNKIFATEIGKNIGLMDGEEFFSDTSDLNNDPIHASLPGNVYYTCMQEEKSCLDDD